MHVWEEIVRGAVKFEETVRGAGPHSAVPSAGFGRTVRDAGDHYYLFFFHCNCYTTHLHFRRAHKHINLFVCKHIYAKKRFHKSTFFAFVLFSYIGIQVCICSRVGFTYLVIHSNFSSFNF